MTVTFSDHCKDGARLFLQTALVIDDCADLGADLQLEPEVRVARRTTGSILSKAAVAEPENPPEVLQPQVPASQATRLNAKALTDAFMSEEVICGVHKPVGPNIAVDVAIKAAARADIVVVDWYLENRSSAKAKEIVTGILRADKAEHGRLRLIAVYTSEPGRSGTAKDLFDAIEVETDIAGMLQLDAPNATIFGKDTRICVFNKVGTPTTADILEVAEKDLPELLIKEFVQLTDGLLPNFAVSAVAAVRRGAHHVLTRFNKVLDGAYLSHRASIDVPEEAEALALDLVAVELSSLIENADVASRTLSVAVIDAWLDQRVADGHRFRTATAQFPPDVLKEVLRGGLARLKDKAGQLNSNGQVNVPNPVSDKTICETFYPDEASSRDAAKAFSRLGSFKREVGRVRLDDFRPRLTLGALLKVRRDLSGKASFTGIDGDYILCVQPRCDSVRLTDEYCAFPFQQGSYDSKRFNLVVDEKGADGYVNINLKPKHTLMLRFRRGKDEDSIFAAKDKSGRYILKDDRGRKFEWVGDLVDLKAQRLASEVGANMHRVGVDEFEWLRLGSESKIKPESVPLTAGGPAA